MGTTTNAGRNFNIWNYTVTTADTSIALTQYANSFIIRCRTAVDIYLRTSVGAATYFTIPANTSFTFDLATSTTTPFVLRSSSGTVIVEILGTQE